MPHRRPPAFANCGSNAPSWLRGAANPGYQASIRPRYPASSPNSATQPSRTSRRAKSVPATVPGIWISSILASSDSAMPPRWGLIMAIWSRPGSRLRPSSSCNDSQPVFPHRRHLCRVAVHELKDSVVAGPADAVARASSPSVAGRSAGGSRPSAIVRATTSRMTRVGRRCFACATRRSARSTTAGACRRRRCRRRRWASSSRRGGRARPAPGSGSPR